MDTCTNIESLRNALIQALNSSGLTIGAGLLVVKDVYNTLYLSYLEELEKEKNRQNFTQEKVVIPFAEETVEVTENDEQNND